MFTRLTVLALALSAGALGCDDSEDLTCEVLASPDFCWRVAVQEAYACTADTTQDCVFDETYAACAYPEDVTATFSPAYPPETEFSDYDTYTIAVSRAGEPCAKLTDNDDVLELKTASGTVSVGGSQSYRVECPDGTTYATDNALGLLSCDGGGLFNSSLPGTNRSGSGRYLSFGMSPAPEDAGAWLNVVFPDDTAPQ